MSLAFNRARFDASPLLFIAVIIFFRTDLMLALVVLHDCAKCRSPGLCNLRKLLVNLLVRDASSFLFVTRIQYIQHVE